MATEKVEKLARRHKRVRKDVFGTPERPRLSVYRSNKNISAQIIDDVNKVTLCSSSSLDKEFEGYGGNVEAAKKVGEALGKKAIEKGISEVCFDRGGNLYHGRVAALADGARSAGLKF